MSLLRLFLVAAAAAGSVLPGIHASETQSAADIPGAGLHLLEKIPLPAMKGTWDHLTSDPRTGRIFANAQDIHTLEIVSLDSGTVVGTVQGPFNRNQGADYLDNLGEIAISNGRSGTVVFLDAATLGVRQTVGIGLGADLMAYDAARQELFVDHGGRDSNRGFGAVAVIDAAKGELIADIATDFRPAAMAAEAAGPRLFVCVPGANQIAVVDRPTRQIVDRFTPQSAKKPVSVALDEADHRLFVLDRTPARLVVLDSRSGATVASLPTVGECEDVFYDAAHRRLYATGLEGIVYCYTQESADAYTLRARVPVRAHAGSSLLIPGLNRFIVAVAEHGADCPELWVYATLP